MFGLDMIAAFFAGLVMWEIFVFGVLCIVIFASLNYESSIAFSLAFVVLMTMSWTGVGSAWAAITLLDLIWFIAVYVVMGIAWSAFKWRQLAIRIRDSYRASVRDGKRLYTDSEIKEQIQIKKNYDTFIFWILVWPLSGIGYIINDFIRDIFTKLIDRISTIYDRITDKVMAG